MHDFQDVRRVRCVEDVLKRQLNDNQRRSESRCRRMLYLCVHVVQFSEILARQTVGIADSGVHRSKLEDDRVRRTGCEDPYLFNRGTFGKGIHPRRLVDDHGEGIANVLDHLSRLVEKERGKSRLCSSMALLLSERSCRSASRCRASTQRSPCFDWCKRRIASLVASQPTRRITPC